MPAKAQTGYLRHILEGIQTTWHGLMLTLRHIREAGNQRKPVPVSDPTYFDQDSGIVTLQYPYESIPVPDHGRYRLHNEMEDCIVCDKCAKVCPVDCIEIEPIKAESEIRKTSDGSSVRLHAAKFDIDMAKCCFCGLCTTVCPTECLTMTPVYDFSEFDVRNMIYHFSDLNPEEVAAKQKVAASRQAARASAPPATTSTGTQQATGQKPVFRPKLPVPPKPSDNKTDT